MRFAAYDSLQGRPNVIVDGYGTGGTVLVLSHWPGAGSPPEIAGDLSTQIAFNYLDRPSMRVDADLVSNNHFDEDGLCGIYALVDPDGARRRRERLVDVASAGDFATWRDRDSARIAMALMAFADEDRSPLPAATFAQPYPAQTAALYEHLLERLPEMLDDPGRVRDLWADEDARLQETLDALGDGRIAIAEHPEIDLAVVRVADGFGGEPHEMGVHNATDRFRVLVLSESGVSLRYRYESWVVYRSRPVMPRVDLRPIAAALEEQDAVRWTAGDVGDLQPALRPAGDSSLPLDRIEAIVVERLRAAA